MTDGRIAAEKFRSTEMKYKRYKISGKDIYIAGDETEICYIGYTEPEGEEVETPLIKEAFSQIEEYMQGKRKEFVLPLRHFGESRPGRVWKEIAKIPYGKTVTYKELCKKTGYGRAYRYIGKICGENPLAIVVPCHRVVGQRGLCGYAGGVGLKRELLELEKRNSF